VLQQQQQQQHQQQGGISALVSMVLSIPHDDHDCYFGP
jgi:hypothetical protein